VIIGNMPPVKIGDVVLPWIDCYQWRQGWETVSKVVWSKSEGKWLVYWRGNSNAYYWSERWEVRR
jgi:hypothetical protein